MGLRRYIVRKLNKFTRWLERDDDSDTAVLNTVSSRSGIEEVENNVNFTLYKAQGGKVIQVKRYDNRKQEWISKLYVITDDENLGEEISQIITMITLTQ